MLRQLRHGLQQDREERGGGKVKSLILIIISGALINNVVLNQFLGICSFLGVSKQMKASASLGGAVIFVITIASAVASLLYDYVLKPFGLDFMKTIVFILVIAALVQIVEMFLKKKSPAIYKSLGIFLPLITTNCAVLGVALTNVQNGYNFLECVLSGFGTALGYTIAIVLLASIRVRIREEDLPAPLRGAPVVMISAALMSIAFMGFGGLSF
ncbi:MAG: electron transport complex protein RnfA [Spirochaetales bacterium]|nr:electron transport complex protein RnfA [Spirochaetales bacterium]